MSLPHNLIWESQPHLGLKTSEFLDLYNFLKNWWIFKKIVAKCSAFVSLSYQVHAKVCNPISLTLCIVGNFALVKFFQN